MANNFIYSKPVNRFVDLDLNFAANPATGDVSRLTDETAIKRALSNLLQLNFYEKPFQPHIGSGVRALLFENITPIVAGHMKVLIKQLVKNYEPRVDLIDISVIARFDQNQYDITLLFRIVNTEEPVTLTTALERLR